MKRMIEHRRFTFGDKVVHCIITDKLIVTVYYGAGRLMRLIHDNVDNSSAAMSVILIRYDVLAASRVLDLII